MPYWLQVMQALLAPAIALGVAVVAFFQWKTARQKLVLDLFDRRFAVFMDVREIVSKGGIRANFSRSDLPNDVIARGRFLFGDDIMAELLEVHRLCVKIEVRELDAHGKLNSTFDRLLLKLVPYMTMDQKLPFWTTRL